MKKVLDTTVKIHRIMESTYGDGTHWIEYEFENGTDVFLGYEITDKVNEDTDISKVEEAINNDNDILNKLTSKPDIKTCGEYLELLVTECLQSENEMWYVDYEDLEDLEVTDEMLDDLIEEVKELGIEEYIFVNNRDYAVLVYGGVITKFLF